MPIHQLPNIISIARFFMVWPVINLYLAESYLWVLVFMVLIAASDAVDGALARKFKWKSKLGAILDPVADKALIMVFFILYGFYNLIPFELMLIVITRDFFILTGFINLRMLDPSYTPEPDPLSKINTFFEFLFIILIMYEKVFSIDAIVIELFSALVVAFSLASFLKYSLVWRARLNQIIVGNA